MKITLLIIFIAAISPIFASAQDAAEEFGIKLGGFVKTDVIYDTRQTKAIREGHFLLFPLGEDLDENGDDANAEPSFNILSVQTRVNGKITAPEIYGIKPSGYIEGAFFGSTEDNINTFRLRHAFVDLDFGSSKLRMGQFWHPMFITECYPDVVSFNTGAPFQPFSRNPQIRFVQNFGDFYAQVAAVSQRDFVSDGPDGKSSKYLRNAVAPEFVFGLGYNAETLAFGALGEYKSLRPYLQIANKIRDETVSSYSAMAYAKFVFKPLTFKIEGVYGQNMSNMTMLGGYYGDLDADDKGKVEYYPINIFSGWTELIYEFNDAWLAGIFAGYSENMGATDDVDYPSGSLSVYGTGVDIKSMLRIAPRIQWQIGKARLAFEIEHTQADYGSKFDDKGAPDDVETVANTRFLLGAYIFF